MNNSGCSRIQTSNIKVSIISYLFFHTWHLAHLMESFPYRPWSGRDVSRSNHDLLRVSTDKKQWINKYKSTPLELWNFLTPSQVLFITLFVYPCIVNLFVHLWFVCISCFISAGVCLLARPITAGKRKLIWSYTEGVHMYLRWISCVAGVLWNYREIQI